jgi:hypothetical protein
VGDRVTITGTGFAPNAVQNGVRLGSLQARVVSAAPHELVVEVPAQARSGLWYVAVAGNAEAHSREPFMVTLRPRITALEPDRGVAGARITLRGVNFPPDRPLVQVRLGDLECAVVSSSPEAIVVEVPRGVQPGPARFSVIVRLQGTGRAEMEFFVLVPTRIAAIEPPAAPVGARVTVRGEGFETDVRQLQIRLGRLAIRPAAASTTSLEFVVPPGAQSGPLAVDAPMRQTATANFSVLNPPVVQTFAPPQGAPGARVTLRGRNFGSDPSAVSVTLGGTTMAVSQVTPTTIVAEVPAGAQTGRIVVRVNGQGEATTPRDYRITTSRPAAAP